MLIINVNVMLNIIYLYYVYKYEISLDKIHQVIKCNLFES